MTESDLVRGLQQVLAIYYPKAWVIKHHGSRFSKAGTPDLSVTNDGPTWWFETKYVRKGEKIGDVVTAIQRYTCRRLWNATKGRCWILAYYQQPREVHLYEPTIDILKNTWEPQPKYVASGHDHGIVREVLGYDA